MLLVAHREGYYLPALEWCSSLLSTQEVNEWLNLKRIICYLLVTPYGDSTESTLAWVLACYLTTPSHYMNRCWQFQRRHLSHKSLKLAWKYSYLKFYYNHKGANQVVVLRVMNIDEILLTQMCVFVAASTCQTYKQISKHLTTAFIGVRFTLWHLICFLLFHNSLIQMSLHPGLL